MFDSLVIVSPAVLAVVPVSIGLVQLLKGSFSERATPFISLLVSIGLAILAVGSVDFSTILQGVVVSLMSMGLFSGTKTTVR